MKPSLSETKDEYEVKCSAKKMRAGNNSDGMLLSQCMMQIVTRVLGQAYKRQQQC